VTIKQQGGVFGRNPEFNDVSASTLQITNTGSANSLIIEDEASDSTPIVATNDGVFVLGTTQAYPAPLNASYENRLQVHGDDPYTGAADFVSWSSGTTSGTSVNLARSDSNVIGTHTALGSNDQIGRVAFWGSDGEKFVSAAYIECRADGTTGVDDMPAHLSFATTPDGGATSSIRMLIAQDGNIGINEQDPDYKLDVNGSLGFTPGSSVTPVDNGDVVFELTNNTTLTIKAKGSDGVVRSGTITLS